ncbi:hypothetical protein BC829DRAFT_14043 [Chytridium lagenaria]|nr:hypothetical protein BC829DRAFT_14043 [Chytridium lagenaria]
MEEVAASGAEDPRMAKADRHGHGKRMRYVKELTYLYWEHDKNSVQPSYPNKVLVTGLPLSLPESELLEFFENSTRATLHSCKGTGQSLGIAIIEFGGDPQEAGNRALRAIKKENGSSIGGSVVKVEFDITGAKCRTAIEHATESRPKKDDGMPLDTTLIPRMDVKPFLSSASALGFEIDLKSPSKAVSPVTNEKQVSVSSTPAAIGGSTSIPSSSSNAKRLPTISIPVLPKSIPPIPSPWKAAHKAAIDKKLDLSLPSKPPPELTMPELGRREIKQAPLRIYTASEARSRSVSVDIGETGKRASENFATDMYRPDKVSTDTYRPEPCIDRYQPKHRDERRKSDRDSRDYDRDRRSRRESYEEHSATSHHSRSRSRSVRRSEVEVEVIGGIGLPIFQKNGVPIDSK